MCDNTCASSCTRLATLVQAPGFGDAKAAQQLPGRQSPIAVNHLLALRHMPVWGYQSPQLLCLASASETHAALVCPEERFHADAREPERCRGWLSSAGCCCGRSGAAARWRGPSRDSARPTWGPSPVRPQAADTVDIVPVLHSLLVC